MPRESRKARFERAIFFAQILAETYPDATCSLTWETPWQLLVATILSAQTTDEAVNKVTPKLFATYLTVQDLAVADPADVEQIINSIGLFRNKTKSILGAANAIVTHFDSEVPQTMAELITLPGVARKTANVVLGNAYEIAEGIVVDTHVGRLALRMDFTLYQKTKTINTDKIEKDLMELIPRNMWVTFGHCMVWHGRQICQARNPLCTQCPLASLCPKVSVKDK